MGQEPVCCLAVSLRQYITLLSAAYAPSTSSATSVAQFDPQLLSLLPVGEYGGSLNELRGESLSNLLHSNVRHSLVHQSLQSAMSGPSIGWNPGNNLFVVKSEQNVSGRLIVGDAGHLDLETFELELVGLLLPMGE